MCQGPVCVCFLTVFFGLQHVYDQVEACVHLHELIWVYAIYASLCFIVCDCMKSLGLNDCNAVQPGCGSVWTLTLVCVFSCISSVICV